MTERSPLYKKIVRLIETGGPISLAEYMHICMADPQHGYYKNRSVIGAANRDASKSGDFITAPEVSQMFGELIGIWMIAAWQAMDRPTRFSLAELGPGKGTLMNDMLRAARQLPDFCKAADIIMVETSDRLAGQQADMLACHGGAVNSISWKSAIDALPRQPTLFIGNEFLDVIPFRQYVKTGTGSKGGWHEVGISVDKDGNLQKGAMASALDIRNLPDGSLMEPEGSVFELAPARQAVTEKIAGHIAEHGGAALLIDYGHIRSGFGDTFQAVSQHACTDPLLVPGEADLTSHVDFAPLERAAQSVDGIRAAITTQSDFLLSLGLLERAGALGANKQPDVQNDIRSQVERLAAPDQMGELFKVMAIMPKGILLPAFTGP